ncbi:MAG: hypothetical protein JWO00_645 [Candidatus Parcubacteria bacterium]|nr:hypothetical protein [Candidatus Parcubacteria bacterium]
MPRRVEDIVRSDRRSIRDTPIDIPEPLKKGGKAPVPKPDIAREVPIHKLKVTAPIHVGNAGKGFPDPAKRKARKARNWWLITSFLVIAFVAIAGYAASIYFSRATFTIVPVTIDAPVDTTIVASATSTLGYLSYKTSTFTGSAKTSVPATTGAFSSTKASGVVTLYNTYSKDSQRLNAGTRLSSDSGLIYRLTGTVVVPGYTLTSKGITPGSLAVNVIADQAGAEYNIPKSNSALTFKIVAYQGGPRYAGFYGHPASDISGGFAGQKKTVDKTLLASTTANLQTALTAELLAKAKAAVPEGYIMYDNAYKTSFAPAAISGTTTDSATVALTGTLYGVLFKTSDLIVKLVGAEKVNSFNAFPYRAPGLESLSFVITNPSEFSPAQQGTLIAKVKGNVKLVGIIPVATLKQKLAGLSLAQTSAILKAYSAIIDIGKSSGELFPSWSMSVPNDESRISIVVKDK